MSASERNQKKDYSRYDQMSTAELEQLLRLDFQAPEDGDSDLDLLLYISDLLAKRNGLSDPDAAWEQFRTKYRPYANGRSLYVLDSGDDAGVSESVRTSHVLPVARPQWGRRLRRLAVLAASLGACLLSGMAVAQAAGADVFGAIARWTDETFSFASTGSGTPSNSDSEELARIQDFLQPLGMANWFPTWHPDGFTPGEPQMTELIDRVTTYVTFFEEDRSYSVELLLFTQPTNNFGTFEKDDTPVEEYVHNGQTFYILSNIDTLTATAYRGELMTIISGALTREEIEAIIDSIPAAPPLPAEEQPMNRLAEE